ncbi:prolyl 4-hydroxylase 1 isoform X2 [Solanum lycopersicum]|uniref:prolyl 4-hydroxylase 1 isoform X2 n=2 Tax=Solanum lycopersicum TaxID=4081 RepID=UPI0037497D6D
MGTTMRIVFGLLTLVTCGMILGALIQLAFIRRMEDSLDREFSFGGKHASLAGSNFPLARGISNWPHDKDAIALRVGYVKPEIISWKPRIVLFHNFLSAEGVKSDVRTSSGMFLNPDERKYPMIQAIEKRISVYSQIPVENGELIQVLRYEKNQFYRAHHDYFSDSFNVKRGGQRIATMLMYLSDNVEGGETYFPMAGTGKCSCGGKMIQGLCVKPTKGDAVLFWSMGLDGQSDPDSLHGGCEVISGEKWSATKWMRQRTVS